MSRELIPVKIHIKEQPAVFERFNVQWTPVLLVLDSEGVERHRWEGYLPPQDFRSQVELGLAHAAFGQKRFDDAARRFRAIVNDFPNTEVAPIALYWAGVAEYKGTNDASALQRTAQAFRSQYQDSTWAKKASVWGG